ncbi:MAG: beta-propeller fold lactonase family protein, partial [Miltoncostaeaceae bacterium]
MSRAARAVGKRYTSIRSPLAFLWSTERRVHAVALSALAVGLAYLGWRISSTLLGAPLWLSLSLLAVEIAGLCQLALLTRTAWRLPDQARRAAGSRAGVVVLAAGSTDEEIERTLLGVERMEGASGVAVASNDIAAAIAGLDGDLVVVLRAGQVPHADLIDPAAACLGPRDGAVALASELANPDSLDWAVTGAHEHAVESEVDNPGRSARGEAILPAGGFLARRDALDDTAGAAGGLAQTVALWRAGWDTRHCAVPTLRELGAETLGEYAGRARRDALGGLRAAREVPRRGLRWGQRLTLAGAILPSTSGVRIAALIGVAIASLLTGRLPIAAPPAEIAVATASAFAACGAGYLALGRGRAAAGDRLRRSLRTMGSSVSALAAAVVRRTTIRDPRRPAAPLIAALLALDAALFARGASAFLDLGLPSFGTRATAAVAVVAALVLVAVALDVLQLLVRRRQARRHYRVPERLPITVGDTSATCIDLTPAGLRAEVPAGYAPSIGSTVRMELQLPETTPPISLHGVVRSCSGGTETVRLGIELEADSRPAELLAHYWLAPRDSTEVAEPNEADLIARHPMRARLRAGLRAATAGAGGLALVALAVPAVAAGGLSTGTIIQLSGSAACVADGGTDCTTARGLANMQDIAVSHDGDSLYTTDYDSSIVGAFSINQSTGALSQTAGTAGCIAETATDGCLDGKGLSGVRGIAISPDDRNVYIGAVDGDSVAVLDRDLASGALSQSTGTDGCVSLSGSGGACATGRGLDGPGTPAVSPDGRNLYVPGDLSDAIAVFSRDGSSGDLAQLSGSDGCVSETGAGGCADGDGLLNPRSVVVSPDGKHVYAASQQGAIAAFARDAGTGALTQLAGAAACVHNTGAGGCADGRALDSARWVLISPDGQHVYVVTTGGKSIAAFARNSSTGALTQPAGTDGCIAASGSDGCLVAPHMNSGRGGAISPDGATLYGAFQGSNAVAVLRRSDNGALAPLSSPHGCVHNSAADPCSDALAMGGPTDVAVSHDGAWVYVAGRTSDSMAAFKRELSPTCQPRTASTGSSTAVQLT